nr:cyclopropane fatty acyl phospholipid synthase [Rhodoferax sp.]
MDFFEKKVRQLLNASGIQVGGSNLGDIEVKNPAFYRRFLTDGRLGLGESYMDGWWECDRIDVMLFKILSAQETIIKHVQTPETLARVLLSKIMPYGSVGRSSEIGKFHYDIGNELYGKILDPYWNYTCGYWQGGAENLEQAQLHKMERICQKLKLSPGMTLLDIGCGWGGFSKYAAEKYGAHVTGISISQKQIEQAKEFCAGLPIDIRYLDYRDLHEKYDRISTIGMIEHVGKKYYRGFMEKVSESLKDDGIFCLHTIGFNTSDYNNPWLDKYIFPGCYVPSIRQIGQAYEGLFVLEHVENIGYSYAKTLRCWYDNFERHWAEVQRNDPVKYNDIFYRTWRYYLLSCIGGFEARKIQLWQFVFSKNGIKGGYVFPQN